MADVTLRNGRRSFEMSSTGLRLIRKWMNPGTTIQTVTDCANLEQLQKEYEESLAEKISEGYRVIGAPRARKRAAPAAVAAAATSTEEAVHGDTAAPAAAAAPKPTRTRAKRARTSLATLEKREGYARDYDAYLQKNLKVGHQVRMVTTYLKVKAGDHGKVTELSIRGPRVEWKKLGSEQWAYWKHIDYHANDEKSESEEETAMPPPPPGRKVRGDFPAGLPGEHMYAVYVQQALRPRTAVRLRADATKKGVYQGSTQGASGALLAEVVWAGSATRDRVDWVDLELDASG
eukprot:m.236464 g.236464  ORF g.236464 m.236464 type:complete len:290 (+) comp20617_c0_seq1:70-939(+)